MAGDAERLAKVLAFGILRIAIEEDREAYLINFSVQVRTLDLRAVGQRGRATAFLRMSFTGTDVTLAFSEALQKLGEGRFQDADVLLVSDFIMQMSGRVMAGVKPSHNHDARASRLTFQRARSRPVRQLDPSGHPTPSTGGHPRLAGRVRGLRTSGVMARRSDGPDPDDCAASSDPYSDGLDARLVLVQQGNRSGFDGTGNSRHLTFLQQPVVRER